LRLQIDVRLELGSVAETVSVSADAPLLDTSTVSCGRVLDNRSITDLPVIGTYRAAAEVRPGVQTGGINYYTGLHAGGNVGSNEWTIDGAPNNGPGRTMACLPHADTVQEVSVETSGFDAAIGHTTGIGISMMTKTGTNQFHGTFTEQHWQSRWQAAPFFTRLSGVNNTVPTLANRRGDFYLLLNVDAARDQIYDPLTVRADPARSGNFVRNPIPRNLLPASRAINPAYQAYLKLLPQPNNDPLNPRNEPSNNYLATAVSQIFDYKALTNRVDYRLSSAQRFFVRWMSYRRRVFPTRIGGVRRDMTNQWNGNLRREFRIRERLVLQLQCDVLNIQNRSQFDAPEMSPYSTNFGKIPLQTTGTNGWIQVQGRLRF
jgi:hypothetical protein